MNDLRRPVRLRLSWTVAVPLLALVVLLLTRGRELPVFWVVVVAVILAGAVLAAVHHAEVVAHRVGEPYGSLVLAVAVTVIEVALIVTLMVSGGSETETLARDTVFAAVMITTNGIAGLAFLLGSLRHGLAHFNPEGSGAALATVATLATLSLVLPPSPVPPGPSSRLPNWASPPPRRSSSTFCSSSPRPAATRDFFSPVTSEGHTAQEDDHAPPPTRRATRVSLALLLVALVAVVGLAMVESPAIESGVEAAGFPHSFVGVVIALLVLLPEILAAARAALHGRIQISLNLAHGSAMASIGLTIPVIAVASVWLDGPLLLGLGNTQLVLLLLTAFVSGLTVVPGRATRLQGGIHLVLLAAFLFLAINP